MASAGALTSLALWVGMVSIPFGGLVVQRLGRPFATIVVFCALAAASSGADRRRRAAVPGVHSVRPGDRAAAGRDHVAADARSRTRRSGRPVSACSTPAISCCRPADRRSADGSTTRAAVRHRCCSGACCSLCRCRCWRCSASSLYGCRADALRSARRRRLAGDDAAGQRAQTRWPVRVLSVERGGPMETIVGSGKYTYKVHEDWAQPPAGIEMRPAAVSVDPQDRVYCFNRNRRASGRRVRPRRQFPVVVGRGACSRFPHAIRFDERGFRLAHRRTPQQFMKFTTDGRVAADHRRQGRALGYRRAGR